MRIPLLSSLLFGLSDGAVCDPPALTGMCQGLPDDQTRWVEGWLVGIRDGQYRLPAALEYEVDAPHFLQLNQEQALAYLNDRQFRLCLQQERINWYVAKVDLSGTGVANIYLLGSFLDLRELDLSWTGVVDLAHLTRLTYLKYLNLTGLEERVLDTIFREVRERELQGALTIDYGAPANCLK